MIVTGITGGLGNQMFQYAIARAISLRLNDPDLVLEHGILKGDPLRQYELDAFHLPVRFGGPMDHFRQRLSFGDSRHPARRVAKTLLPWLVLKTFQDAQRGFDPALTQVRGNVYLLGNWQSEKYFKAFAEQIQNDFTFANPPDDENRRLLDAIGQGNAIALHVRRGDYVSLPHIREIHGVCGLDYYRAAIDLMQQRTKNAHYFIFSDDPEWTAANIKLDAPATYVTHNTGNRSREDLRLMTACKHFIIANSTFSWWGAWLSRHAQKVVIAPRHWFAQPHASDADKVPPEWTTLDIRPTTQI